ncbi:aminoglycoside phosphotransferase family protein [Patescibacteria group bacterium]
MQDKLKDYFKKSGLGEVSKIEELAGSNHLNYKVTTSKGVYVARFVKPEGLSRDLNLSNEYKILQLLENYDIAPKSILLDLESFETPLLIEEFIDGVPFRGIEEVGGEMFEKSIDLLVKISELEINKKEFPFKFFYHNYEVSFKSWSERLGEIENFFGKDSLVVADLNKLIKKVQNVLEKKEDLLKNSKKEFIYNDLHLGNMFWSASEKKTKLIDWQKVSLGDPAFMLTLFIRRFYNVWNMSKQEFLEKAFSLYNKKKKISLSRELLELRILEREMSDAVWVVWASVKKSGLDKNYSLNDNKYYLETKRLLLKF